MLKTTNDQTYSPNETITLLHTQNFAQPDFLVFGGVLEILSFLQLLIAGKFGSMTFIFDLVVFDVFPQT